MPGGVEHHAHAFLRLVFGDARAARDRMRDCRMEIVDLDIEVDHLVLRIGALGPRRCSVSRIGLERQTRATFGIAHQHEVRFGDRHVPTEQRPVEVGHRMRISAVDTDGLDSE